MLIHAVDESAVQIEYQRMASPYSRPQERAATNSRPWRTISLLEHFACEVVRPGSFAARVLSVSYAAFMRLSSWEPWLPFFEPPRARWRSSACGSSRCRPSRPCLTSTCRASCGAWRSPLACLQLVHTCGRPISGNPSLLAWKSSCNLVMKLCSRVGTAPLTPKRGHATTFGRPGCGNAHTHMLKVAADHGLHLDSKCPSMSWIFTFAASARWCCLNWSSRTLDRGVYPGIRVRSQGGSPAFQSPSLS